MLLTFPRQLRILTGKLCLIELVAWGVLYYTFSVFLPAMRAELGWSNATLAGGFSLALLVAGASAPFVGAWIDRRGSRGLMVAGALMGSLGVVLWSLAQTLSVYLTAWALIGAGMAGTLYAPAFATVVRHCPRMSRSAILMITVVGALASTIFMPLASMLGEVMGWRLGLIALAATLAVVVTPLAASLPSGSRPADDRDQFGQASERRTAPGGFSLLAGAFMVADAASVAAHVHLVAFLVEKGQSLHAAASIAGLAGAAKIGGRLATALGTKATATLLMRASLLLMAGALMLPLLWPSNWTAVVMVIGFGAANGARTVLRPAIMVEVFGAGGFGKSNGLLQLCTMVSKAAGPVGFGLVLGAAGWSWAWPGLIVLLLFSCTLLPEFPAKSEHSPTSVETTSTIPLTRREGAR